MVFGRPDEERIQLNENTLVGRLPRETTNPDALKYLPEVRRLLFAGKNAEATAMVEKLMGRPMRIRPYQSLGDAFLQFDVPYEVGGYRRELDLEHAVTRVRYTVGDVTFRREHFASAPGGVIVVRLTASKPGQITTRVRSVPQPGRHDRRRRQRSPGDARTDRAAADGRVGEPRPALRRATARDSHGRHDQG